MFTVLASDSQALQRSPGRAEGHHSAEDDSLGAGEVGIKNNRIVLTLFITSLLLVQSVRAVTLSRISTL